MRYQPEADYGHAANARMRSSVAFPDYAQVLSWG